MNWMQAVALAVAIVGLVLGGVILWCCLAVCADCDDWEGKR